MLSWNLPVRVRPGSNLATEWFAFILMGVELPLEADLLTVEHSSYHLRSKAYLLAEFFEYQKFFDVRKEVENPLEDRFVLLALFD